MAPMPELPDLTVYLEALQARVLGQPLAKARLASPFLLRTADPPLSSITGRPVREVRRLGKRLVLSLEGDLHLALHLMIAGRLHWKAPGAALPGRVGLLALDFPTGTLTLTEAGTKRRAAGDQFPEKVTAFREGMAVHGRHRQPCPDCGTLVQRIVRADNEVNYCPRCQTGGRILSDRSLARLLKADWPRTIEALEQHPVLSKPRAR